MCSRSSATRAPASRTLLDALCVALFDRTPRLTNHSRVVVGRSDEDPGALGAQDVRTLLRRGAAAGWAEVDFESGDGQQFRARWSVRRARGRVDGTIQPQQVSLVALEGGVQLGGTKTETLDAIHARLGLSFDQFRRSALLAQGEFAAFLRADGKDRSELLERMTGTEIYTRLSIAAHLRASLAEQQLRDGRAAALAIAVLDGEARATAEAEHVLAEEATRAARARLAEAETCARWIAEAAHRDGALVTATAELAAATRALDAAAPQRDELALRRRAEQLRGPWDEVARGERQLAISRGDVVAAATAAASARDAQHAIDARRQGLGELHAPIRAARIAAGLVERHAPADRAGAGARAEALGTAALADARWLVERRGLAPEVAAWTELDGKFAQDAALGEAIRGHDRDLAEHATARTRLAASRTILVGEHQAALAALGEAQRTVASFHQRRGLTLDQARKQEDEARSRQTDAERLVAIAAGAREAGKARTELDRQLAELAEAATADAAQHDELELARATALAVRAERARVALELRRAAGYDHARTELRGGEECPLCGATEHPWANRGAFDDVIAAAEAKLAEVSVELDAVTATFATLTARATHRDREQLRLAKLRATAAATADGSRTTWREHLVVVGELPLVDDPASPAAEALAVERAAFTRQRLEEARDVRLQTEAAMKAVHEAQAQVQARQTTVDLVAGRLAEVDRKLAELATTIERVTGERVGRAERHAELEAELDAAIARWRLAVPDAAAAGDVASPRASIAELAAAWRTRADRVAAADAELAAAASAIERDARDAERAVAEHAARLADCERRRDEHAAAVAQATALLDDARAGSGLPLAQLHELLSGDPTRVEQLAESLAALDRALATARTVVAERRRLIDEHAATRPDALADATSPAPEVEACRAAVAQAEAHAARLGAVLAADTDARTRRADALALLATAEAGAEVDRILGEVIGSHDGKAFRSFAQSLTLDGLLAVANTHLDELAPRYQLERVPKHDLELQVIDRDLGHEVRSVQSLSGGESFLVSLALALGLSSMSAHDVRVRTLLIDEGFGTLDPSTLEVALSVLEALRQAGRQVGVISHVPQLVERVGAHVRVVQRGGGRSEVIVA